MKKIALVLGLLLLVGCSDKPKEETTKTTSAPVKQEAKIEIVQNENSKDIKVEEKKVDTSENKAYYYDYNNDNKAEDKTYTQLDAYNRVRSPYEAVEIRLMANKLSKDFILKCSPCHDDYANGVIGPSLLSKDSAFIYQRIMDYKNGTKKNVLMTDLVKMMSDEQLKAIADEIAVFNEKIRKIKEGK